MYCTVGHLTECHYPIDCALAACSHLAEYDFDTDEINKIRAASREIFVDLADPNCPTCEGTAFRMVSTTVKELHEIEDDSVEDEYLHLETPCDCVLDRMVKAMEESRARAPNPDEENEAGSVQSCGKQTERPDPETTAC
jgi:hypothetical protein